MYKLISEMRCSFGTSERIKHGDVFKLFPRKRRNGKRLAKIKILTLSNRMWVGVRER